MAKEKNVVFISHDQQTWSVGEWMGRLFKLQKRLVARGAKVYIVDNRANLTSSGVAEALKNTDVMVPMLTAAYYEGQGVTELEMALAQRQTWVFPVLVDGFHPSDEQMADAQDDAIDHLADQIIENLFRFRKVFR